MDKFVEVSSESWFSRIVGSIKGMIFGGLLFLGSFPFLFFNEGRAVDTLKSLQEGAGNAKTVSADKINPANEGKLVHVTGNVKNPKPLFDEGTGVERQGLTLRREVSMYQWKEVKEYSKNKKVGGEVETKTTYTYKLGWHSGQIDSKRFKKVEGHQNPPLPLQSSSVVAESATLGAFSVPEEIVSKIGALKNFVPDPVPDKLKTALAGRTITKTPDFLYVGNSLESPEIGDLKIQFKFVPNSPATIVAGQMGNSFGTYLTSYGREIQLVENGRVALKTMFKRAETRNSYWTWGLRLLGFLLMWWGLNLVLGPLVTIADVLPFLGSIVAAGTGIATLLLSLCLSSVTIAFAWLFYRPVLGIGLLAAAACCLYLLNQRRSTAAKKISVKPPMPTSMAA